MQRALLVALLALALMSGCHPLSGLDNALHLEATGGGMLQPGEGQAATLGSITEAHDWEFEGRAGQTITVIVEGEGDVDPRVTLLGPEGMFLSDVNDNEGPVEVLRYTLPINGIYTIRVDVFQRGAYTITLMVP